MLQEHKSTFAFFWLPFTIVGIFEFWVDLGPDDILRHAEPELRLSRVPLFLQHVVGPAIADVMLFSLLTRGRPWPGGLVALKRTAIIRGILGSRAPWAPSTADLVLGH